jgi:AraC family transcriptional regulator
MDRRLERVLAHVQAHLDEDLSLRALAALSAASPFHFHRLFKRSIGETSSRYVRRLRLERAAHALLLHRGTVLDVALECGYSNHETFTRAFHRRFGVAPVDFRARGLLACTGAMPDRRVVADARATFELSRTRVQYLQPRDYAFVRFHGPYEEVPEEAWARIVAWARRKRLGPGRLLGIGHDAPGPEVTPRFDAAVTVERAFTRGGRYRHVRLPGGPFALTRHVGPYATLTAAYPRIAAQSLALDGYRLVGLPAIEVYHAAAMDASHRLNQTDIYLRLAPMP